MNKITTEPTFTSSVICMDMVNIDQDVKRLKGLGHKYLHIDVMDGSYVPRYGMFPEMVKRIHEIAPEMIMDVHMMVDNPEFCAEQFNLPGVDTITFHIDGNEHNAIRIIDKIKKMGKRAGVACNLSTNLDITAKLVNMGIIDFVMMMGIHPGVLVQEARPEMLSSNISEFMNKIGYNKDVVIAVDGGVTYESIDMLKDTGATFFVGGSGTIYNKARSVEANSKKIKGVLNV